jgi:hypothetical protein
MMMAGVWWLLFTLWESVLSLGPRSRIEFVPLGLLAFGVFVVLQRLGLRPLARATRRTPNVRLLLLRTFGARGRSERLLRALGLHWRYIGSIQMIAGTDLASASVEPHQFLDFVTGRLRRQFVSSEDDLERRLGSLDLAPDPDGRFRINQLFGHDDTWQAALARLVALSDAVVMDLRGFSSRHSGCIHEIQQLVNLVPAGRVVLLYDASTDLPLLEHSVHRAWIGMDPQSPNRSQADAVMRLLRVRGERGDLKRLLSALCAAARPGEAAGQEGTAAHPVAPLAGETRESPLAQARGHA